MIRIERKGRSVEEIKERKKKKKTERERIG
jgi:hypothetical protein